MKRLTWLAAGIATVACLALPAQATVTDTTVGLVRTISENFNGGESFSGSNWYVPGGSDGYMSLTQQTSNSSFASIVTTALSSFSVSFWYTGSGTGDVGSVTLERTSPNPDTTVFTNSFTAVAGTNPGPGTGLQFVSTTFTNLVAGTYELTFARVGNGSGQQFRVDDVVVTVSSVPEPTTIAMILAGLGLVGVATRRKRPSATF